MDRVKPEAFPPKDQYRHVGESVTFTCVGDYGCTSDSARDVSWTDENWDPLYDRDIFPRYNVTTVEKYSVKYRIYFQYDTKIQVT